MTDQSRLAICFACERVFAPHYMQKSPGRRYWCFTCCLVHAQDVPPFPSSSELMNHEYESKYRDLLFRLDRDRAWMTVYPVRFVDTKTRDISTTLTGRAQGALCIYCNRQIHAWGKLPKGQRSRLPSPWDIPGLKSKTTEHCFPCSQDWIWETLARWSTGRMDDREARAIGEWRAGLEKNSSWQVEKTILGMFDRLPLPMGPITDELEVALTMLAREIERWPDHWRPFVHGDDEHPHVWFPTYRCGDTQVSEPGLHTVADARCPCGKWMSGSTSTAFYEQVN